MKGNRRADTKPEIALRSALHRAGLRFRKDYAIELDGRRVRPDIAFPRLKLAVFVDGCFWHLCPNHGRIPGGKNAAYWKTKLEGNRARDHQNTERLQNGGWTVIRIWEHVDIETAAGRIAAALDNSPVAPDTRDAGQPRTARQGRRLAGLS